MVAFMIKIRLTRSKCSAFITKSRSAWNLDASEKNWTLRIATSTRHEICISGECVSFHQTGSISSDKSRPIGHLIMNASYVSLNSLHLQWQAVSVIRMLYTKCLWHQCVQCESKNTPPPKFSDICSLMVGNFLTIFYTPITRSYLR